MDSVAGSSLNETLVGLRQRLFWFLGVFALRGNGDRHERHRSWLCCLWSCTATLLLCTPRAVSPLPVPWTGHWQPPQSFDHV